MAKSIARRLAEILEADGDVKGEHLDNADAGLDSAQVTTIAEAAGVVTYSTLDSLPTTGLTAGDQAYVSANNRLYVSNGSGWYNVALINLSPTMSLDQSGTVVLSTEGVATTVTITATDSDNPDTILSYSVESDGNGIGNYTLSQDSSVFTITPLSEDSAANPGTFTLTFKTTDNINTATSDLDFSLSFSNIIDSSAETVLLMKAAGNSATNSAITYQDSSGTSIGFTEQGTPQASTFSPYRSGGYSTRFADGTTAGNLNWSGTTLDSDYTIEAWIYTTEVDTSGYNNIVSDQSTNVQFSLHSQSTGNMYTVYASAVQLGPTSTGTGLNEWAHFVWEREGTTLRHYVNGALLTSATVNDTSFTISKIGQYMGGGYEHHGYIRDLRVLKRAKYGGSSYTVPTSSPAFSDDATTQLIACHLPYIAAEGVSISRTGTTFTSTAPFGPYDYEPWVAANHGGSVYFDGTGDYLVENETAADEFTMGTGDFNFECWYYPQAIPGSGNEYVVAFGQGNVNDHEGFLLGVNANGKVYGYIGSGSAWTSLTSGTAVLPAKTWAHLAIARSGTSLKIFVNGVQDQSVTNSTNIPNANNLIQVGGRVDTNGSTNQYVTGNLADVRLDKGGAVRTAAFTPPTAPLSATANTKLLMNNKSDANIYDAAAANSFVTLNNTSSSTAQRKFTTSSAVYFDGTNDDVTAYNIGLEGDVTFEGWFYQTSATGTAYKWIFGSNTYNGSNPFGLYTYGTALQLWLISSGSASITGTIAQNTWYHVAVVRSSGTWTMYLNGTSQGTSTTSGSVDWADTTDWRWGTSAVAAGSYDWAGYMQDWRISNTARYTANFTPPTAEFEL